MRKAILRQVVVPTTHAHIDMEEVIQIAANTAAYKDRSPSLDNKSKSNFKHTTSI
jgi:hypothetical protein